MTECPDCGHGLECFAGPAAEMHCVACHTVWLCDIDGYLHGPYRGLFAMEDR